MRLSLLLCTLVLGCGHRAAHVTAPPDGGTMAGGGAPTDGPLGTRGVDRFTFAVFGDARPAQPNQDANWPTSVVQSIFQHAEDMGAQFMIGTGDYMFASSAASVQAQLDQFAVAMKPFTGTVYLTMGNHECTGATASNCPAGNETANVQQFLKRLVPFSPTPYFSFHVQTKRGLAKFVFIAANAWSADQQTWLQRAMSEKTDYTFVMRHEPMNGHGNGAPGLAPSDSIIHQFPITLLLQGHSHEYRHSGNEVISGNGGAPLSFGTFGFLLVEQQADGSVAVSEIDQATGMANDTFNVH